MKEQQESVGFGIKITYLEITNFRSFSHLSIDFSENTTVLIAENGGGKTTILDAIAECLKNFLINLLGDNYKDPFLTSKDIKNGTDIPSIISIDTELTYPIKETQYLKPELEEAGEIPDTLLVVSKPEHHNFSVQILQIGKVEYSVIEEPSFKTIFDEDFRKGQDYLPVLVYYGCNSINTEAATTDDIRADSLYHLYYHALSPERFSFQSFLRWFDTAYKIFLVNEKTAKEKEVDNFREIIDWQSQTEDIKALQVATAKKLGQISTEQATFKKNAQTLRNLELLNDCIEKVLNDDLNQKKFKNLRMEYTLSSDELCMDKLNSVGEYEKIEIAQLSAGEKTLFALTADLAKRFILANPHLENPFDGQGIVLIDEIDLHLHPKWQRKVLTKLREIFPNVQFVVTTHSPVILGGIASRYVRSLHNGVIYSVEDTYGRDVEDILETIMQVDAGKYTQKIKKIAALIAMNELQDAEKAIMEMQTEIDEEGDNGADHPDILRMNSLLTRKKIIGR
jgi:predicted ATP-binding protein involved in virulence